MPVYSRDRSFSVGWTIGGVALMFITNVAGGVLAQVLGIRSLLMLVVISVVCFAAGGFLIGWKSEGRTILEAGLAAAIATVLSVVYQAIRGQFVLAPLALVIGVGIPFAAGLAGGWLGEKVQGDTVED
jgi:hypothetical protein